MVNKYLQQKIYRCNEVTESCQKRNEWIKPWITVICRSLSIYQNLIKCENILMNQECIMSKYIDEQE